MGADLDAHDLAEAPAAKLVLHRLQQVCGIVGDLEVGIARHAKDVVIDYLHAREQRVEVVGDDVLEGDEHDGFPRLGVERDEARQDLGRDLHTREHRHLRERHRGMPSKSHRVFHWQCCLSTVTAVREDSRYRARATFPGGTTVRARGGAVKAVRPWGLHPPR